jgi:hypothetical protein
MQDSKEKQECEISQYFYVAYMLKAWYFEHTKLNILLKQIALLVFLAAARNFKITCVAYIIFLMDSASLSPCYP